MSPPRNIPLIYPSATLSIASAAWVNFCCSNTPTTTHALRCFSGFPLFMLNFTVCSLIQGLIQGLADGLLKPDNGSIIAGLFA
jgi:hypothetical protein